MTVVKAYNCHIIGNPHSHFQKAPDQAICDFVIAAHNAVTSRKHGQIRMTGKMIRFVRELCAVF